MRYLPILRTAYQITINNPVLWLSGLFLFGGFNFYVISFFASVTGDRLTSFMRLANDAVSLLPGDFSAAAVAVSVLFVLFNLIKILFIVSTHRFLHTKPAEPECQLCAEQQSSDQSVAPPRDLPYWQWLWKVLAASLVTIFTNAVLLAITAMVVYRLSGHGEIFVHVNFALATLTVTLTGAWNLFTNYFIVLHKMSFRSAVSSAIDLLTVKLGDVLGFILILGVVYALCAMLGNVMIDIWRNGYLGLNSLPVRIVFSAAFAAWFAVTNTFFAAAMLVFFDSLVKAIRSGKSNAARNIKDGQLHPNVLN